MRPRALACALICAALLVPGLHAAAGSAAPAKSSSVSRAPHYSARITRALAPAGEIRGISLNPNPTNLLLSTVPDFPRMAADGITSVTAYVWLYVDNPTASVVSSGPLTPTDSQLQLVSAAASASGMALHLMPVLLDGTHTWRGYYVPNDMAGFFRSYTAQIVHYADLAQTLGVPLLYVGSENESIRKQTASWKALIATVRKHYTGALSYLSTPGATGTTGFWRSLDLAAVSPYFSLGEDAEPTYDRAVGAWRNDLMPSVRRMAALVGIPLIFGEVGYHSQAGTFTQPAHGGPVTAPPAPGAQANAYAALLDTVPQTGLIHGVTWFAWVAGTTAADTSYSPAGKPAECVLAARWASDATVRQLASSPACGLRLALGGAR